MGSDYVWIQTRDGSPTLWHNELGESFRSVKGAFTESWMVFVAPALKHLENFSEPLVTVGEFGLGAGTNWALWTLACAAKKIAFTYTAIERDRASFDLGRKQWIDQADLLSVFLGTKEVHLLPSDIRSILSAAPLPEIIPSLEEFKPDHTKFHIWFHDPFGYSVNPEGYSFETLQLCARLWAPRFWGGSYACNRHFKESLESLQPAPNVEVVSTGDSGLKRERIEFSS